MDSRPAVQGGAESAISRKSEGITLKQLLSNPFQLAPGLNDGFAYWVDACRRSIMPAGSPLSCRAGMQGRNPLRCPGGPLDVEPNEAVSVACAATAGNSLRQGLVSTRHDLYEISLFRAGAWRAVRPVCDTVDREIGGLEQRVSNAGQGICRTASPRLSIYRPDRDLPTGAQYAMRLRQF
jgi:hypothetical protein